MYTKEELKIKLKKSFNNLEIPETLNKLIDFMQDHSDNFFSSGFEYRIDENNDAWKTYSEDPNFYNYLFEFANAEGSGSSYAFWINNNQTELEDVPIVVSGSEGGIHIVAKNIKELLHILAADCEPMIDFDGVHYISFSDMYDDEEDYTSKYHSLYLQWLKNNFNYEHFPDPNEIVKKAQDKYQKQFNEWIEQFY